MKSQLDMEITTYLTYLAKPFIGAKFLLTTPVGLTIFSPTIIGLAALSNETKAWYFLFVVFIADFLTGITASYYENLQLEKAKPSYQKIADSSIGIRFLFKLQFFIRNISSEKLRKSVVKAIGYALFIILSYIIQHLFKIKTWSFDSFSHLEWSLTLLAQAICIAFEIWSILFENFKRMGLDFIEMFLNVFTKYKEIKKEIKEDSE